MCFSEIYTIFFSRQFLSFFISLQNVGDLYAFMWDGRHGRHMSDMIFKAH